MRLPDLLIIGAMKSGTTGLFMDLCRHPGVYLPSFKEPFALGDDEVLTPVGRTVYEANYAAAGGDQLLCDASTGYAKLPEVSGVVNRALEVLPSDFRVVYVVREPIDRIISQHYHEFIEKLIGPDIDAAVREEPRFLDYSRYGYQLTPWINAIGRERVKVIPFESYKTDRQATVAQLCEFLGLPVDQLPEVDSAVVNRSEEKAAISPFWLAIHESGWYKRCIRPLVSPELRQRLQKTIFPKAPERPAAPSPETVAWLREQLAGEVRQISDYAGSADLLWKGYDQAAKA